MSFHRILLEGLCVVRGKLDDWIPISPTKLVLHFQYDLYAPFRTWGMGIGDVPLGDSRSQEWPTVLVNTFKDVVQGLPEQHF